MSYILEALKKAQAERQLGSAPTIHALPAEPVSTSEGRARVPMWLALAVAVLVIFAMAVVVLRPAPVAAPVVVTAPVTVVAPAPAPAPVAAPVQVVAAPAIKAPPLPAIVTPPPAPAPTPAPAPVAALPKPQPARMPSTAPEDSLPAQTSLPESVQRELPQITFGGYMYSTNPADRLLLIDKVLRHEGEEVAPGLVLEKLLPKAAVMNYRGVRYRVAY